MPGEDLVNAADLVARLDLVNGDLAAGRLALDLDNPEDARRAVKASQARVLELRREAIRWAETVNMLEELGPQVDAAIDEAVNAARRSAVGGATVIPTGTRQRRRWLGGAR